MILIGNMAILITQLYYFIMFVLSHVYESMVKDATDGARLKSGTGVINRLSWEIKGKRLNGTSENAKLIKNNNKYM